MDSQNVVSRLHGRKFFVLLCALLFLMVLDPLMAGLHPGRKLFDFLFCMVLLATVFAVSQHPRPFLAAVVLAVPTMVITWTVYGFSPSSSAGAAIIVARHLASMLFLGFTAGVILYDVLLGESISADKICGAICAYLLIGLAWGLLYSLCDHIYDDAFSMDPALVAAEVLDAQGEPPVSVYVYYSFTTLTTLGYGDMSPIPTPVRTFAWLEAVVGQLYIAVLVARLVGLHIAESQQP
jgi:hypothetical protein